MSARLSIRNLQRPGLEPLSLELAVGECVTITGPSGAGKTLLLRAIADLDPNEGTVCLDGTDRDAVPAPEWRRKVRYLAAEPGWWAEHPADHFGDPDSARRRCAAVELAPDLMEAPVSRLSTGERQRLALLRALEGTPSVFLLDEPTAALDTVSRDAVAALLAGLLAEGSSLILVAHDDVLTERLGHRHYIMAAGRMRPA